MALPEAEAAREREAAGKLQRLDELKDAFLANTSHELRTPLHGMVGIAESPVDGASGPLPRSAVGDLGMVISSGRRLSALVDDILDFSKLKQGELHLARSSVGLCRLVEIVLALSAPLVGKRPIRLVNAVDPELPPVSADVNRLEQVLHNLVGNAIKFTDSGTVTVSASPEGGCVDLSVADTGIGIPKEHHEGIFRSFEQLGAGDRRG